MQIEFKANYRRPLNSLFSGEIKLCDFGESRILEQSLASTYVGTMAYWPPEHFQTNREKYDSRSDVWSFGITLMETLLGKLPYMDQTNSESVIPIHTFALEKYVTETDYYGMIDELIGQSYSRELCEFLKFCLVKDVEKRAKIGALCQTIFYGKYKKTFNVKAISKSLEPYV